MHDTRTRHSVAGVLGGGVKYHVSSRWGLRFDARVALSKAAANTDLDATPNVARLTPAGRGALGGNPSIQFSNNSTDPVTSTRNVYQRGRGPTQWRALQVIAA